MNKQISQELIVVFELSAQHVQLEALAQLPQFVLHLKEAQIGGRRDIAGVIPRGTWYLESIGR
jgi:hypothetical protein